ncbi:MAG TPA: cellulase family glycosylhydrolase [Acidobacteriaceae bacterium]|jgi:endo-1,4-beta-mannosidase|nr:cellulase family glycosylhydrolase [Acidobacteriaceae bacterium]
MERMKTGIRFGVALACGLSMGASGFAQSSGQPAESGGSEALPAVHLNGNYFERDGKPFIAVGVNWVPAKAAMEWPYQWDPAAIEADFAQMHALGVNAVRLDLVWAFFEPRPGDYNPEAWKELDFLVSLANRYKIYLHPELFIGGEVGEAYWDVPYRNGRNPQSDPYMLRLETDFAAELARRYGKSTAILGWDLTDEPPFWIVAGSTTDAEAINWTRLISGAIRRYDTLHPIVVGTSTEDLDHGPFRADNLRNDVDFFSAHPYTIYEPKLFPDPMLSERQTFGAAFQSALEEGAGHPVMIQEVGASTAQYDPQAIADYERAALYSSLGAGANGFLIWCYTDAAPSQYAKVPYLRSPHETQFGIVTWDRKEKPAAKMLQDFSDVTARLDLQGVAPAAAEAAILVPNEWSKPYGDESHFGLTGPEIAPYTSTEEGGSVAGQALPNKSDLNARLTGAWLSSYILARQAGVKPDFPREYADWQKYSMVLLPSPLTSTNSMMIHLHSDFWGKARSYVENGGVLYASVSGDAAIPEMGALFGARLVDHAPVRDVILKVVAPFGSLKPGDTFTYSASPDAPEQWAATLEVKGGEVIAVDQDGRPALVAHRLGKGSTLLCAYPIESYLANQPSAFEGAQSTWRLYQSLIEWAGVRRLVWTDNPSVEAAALNGEHRGYFVLVNHSPQAQHVALHTSLPVTEVEGVTSEGIRPVAGGAGATVDLQPWEGAVLAWK